MFILQMIHNELLLRFCENPERALEAVTQLANDDPLYSVTQEPMSSGDIVSIIHALFLSVFLPCSPLSSCERKPWKGDHISGWELTMEMYVIFFILSISSN